MPRSVPLLLLVVQLAESRPLPVPEPVEGSVQFQLTVTFWLVVQPDAVATGDWTGLGTGAVLSTFTG